MDVLRTLWLLMGSLPEIIKLLQVLQEKIDQAKVDRKVSDDIQTIHGAFSSNDATQLNNLFNSK